MVMRVCTGSGAAQTADGGVKGKNGGQSPNTSEILKYVASEAQMMRIAAVTQASACPGAVAYLAVTAQHEDVREAAKALMLKNGLKVLGGMLGRTLEPWEREAFRMIKEGYTDSKAWDAKLVDARIFQIEKGAKFDSFDRCTGEDGNVIQFTEESPPSYDEGTLARILDSYQP
ncbi:hypothetical protein H0O01_04160 [Candidatus Micrarchaeota archaeon]|nr:hypothetical protein [Candidatus Micrarchaeota archaeon]